MDSKKLNKRKQLKTRKYRNKLRKLNKELKINDINEKINYVEDVSEVRYEPQTKISNNLIAANRLTSKVFPRAVTSETITRSSVGRINNEMCNTHTLVDNKLFGDAAAEPVQFNLSPVDNLSLTPVTVHNRSEVYNTERQFSFSPEPEEYNIYDNLVSEFLTCVEDYLPNPVHGDIMIHNRKLLKDINYPKYDDMLNDLQHDILSPNAISTGLIKESPKKLLPQRNDYLASSSESCISGDQLSSPLTISPTSPIDPLLFHSASDNNDTPEYKFYPHKL